MSAGDLLTLSPLIALTVAPVIVMLAAAFARSHVLALALTLIGLGVTVGTLFVAAGAPPRSVTPLLAFDSYALFYMGLIAVATAWSPPLVELPARRRDTAEEYYVLLLTATLGGATLVASTHFASFFLGLEILSVSLYALIVYPRLRERVRRGGRQVPRARRRDLRLPRSSAWRSSTPRRGTMTLGGLAALIAAGLGGSNADRARSASC